MNTPLQNLLALALLTFAGCSGDDPSSATPESDAGGGTVAAGRPAAETPPAPPPDPAAAAPAGPPPAAATPRDFELENLQKAVADDPENASALQTLGRAYARRADWENARSVLEQALAIDDGFHVARADLGEVLLALGKPDEGLELIKEACAGAPEDVELRFRLAVGLRGAGRAEEAEAVFNMVLSQKPDFSRARFERGVLRASRGRLAEAILDFEQVTKEVPTLVNAYINLGRAHNLDGEPAKAVATYRDGLEALENHPELLGALAWILATHPDPAVRDGNDAVHLANRLCHDDQYKNPLYLDILGAACAERGFFEPAIRYASKALDIYLTPGGPGTKGAYGHHVQALQQRLSLYQAEKPYHVAPAPPSTDRGPNDAP